MANQVSIELTVSLRLDLDRGVDLQDVVNEMDYSFELPPGARLLDSEVLEYSAGNSVGSGPASKDG